jgi:hypothetical protein
VQVLLRGSEPAHGRRLVMAPVLMIAPVESFWNRNAPPFSCQKERVLLNLHSREPKKGWVAHVRHTRSLIFFFSSVRFALPRMVVDPPVPLHRVPAQPAGWRTGSSPREQHVSNMWGANVCS